MELTWTQGVFAFCGGILAPAAGVLSGCLRWRDGLWNVAKGFFFGLTAVICSLIASAFLAKWTFPGYPNEPVPEPLAICFTVPVLAVAVIAVALSSREVKDRSRPASPLLAICGVAAIYLAGIVASYHFFTWPYRKALSWTAANVREHAVTDLFIPDFQYFLRADISEAQFTKYVGYYDLKSEVASPYFALQGNAPAWWVPTPIEHEIFSAESGGWRMSAVYDKGTMWVVTGGYSQ